MKIAPQELSAEAFSAFGQVIEMAGAPDFAFNDGRAQRWHDLIAIECDANGQMGLSLCCSAPVQLPYALQMVERHPLASQAFLPLDDRPFLIITAHDKDGTPQRPQAFLSNGRQGINFKRNIWHGVLAPLDAPQDFMIFDRVDGEGNNLEVYAFEDAPIIA